MTLYAITQMYLSEFPAQLDSEMESYGVRESVAWGPQTLVLLSGLVLLYLFVVREAGLFWNWITTGIAGAMALLAALAVQYAVRRHARRIVLLPWSGQLGLYRGGVFQYSFGPAEMLRNPVSTLYTLHELLIMLAMIAIAGLFLWEGVVRNPAESPPADLALGIYPLFFAIFGLVAVVRSHVLMAWYWLPNGKGKTNVSIGLSRKENRKLQSGKPVKQAAI